MAEQQGSYTNEASFHLSSKQMDLDAGFLGKFFGGPANAPVNIAGLVLILLIVVGVICIVVPTLMQPEPYWKLCIPIITLILGFLFGKKTS